MQHVKKIWKFFNVGENEEGQLNTYQETKQVFVLFALTSLLMVLSFIPWSGF